MVIEMDAEDWRLTYRVFGLVTVYLMFITVVAIIIRHIELALWFVEIGIITFIIHLVAWEKYTSKKYWWRK